MQFRTLKVGFSFISSLFFPFAHQTHPTEVTKTFSPGNVQDCYSGLILLDPPITFLSAIKPFWRWLLFLGNEPNKCLQTVVFIILSCFKYSLKFLSVKASNPSLPFWPPLFQFSTCRSMLTLNVAHIALVRVPVFYSGSVHAVPQSGLAP